MIDALVGLVEHMCWADDRAYNALVEAPHHPRALELYGHVLGAEQIWLERIRGGVQGPVWPPFDRVTATACESLRSAVRIAYTDMVNALTLSDLSRRIAYVNSAGDAFETTLRDILLHVVLHGAYHRGQIALLIRDAGARPPTADYVEFVRGAAAATRVDAAEPRVTERP
jgi:uncharacterized damage-inducible protein DinB